MAPVCRKRGGLLDIEVAVQAVFKPVAGQVLDLLLNLDVLAGDAEARLESARCDVIARHIRQQRHKNAATAEFRGANFGVGRLDNAALAAENVQFPCSVEPSVE